ncbi:IPT/TIG domain-containing protein [Streptomyces shenzhenensis]|uniref:IPT/TIG domain-containing protein n=1 Tax=Streptomyces shenzhenensis TaxID=943815 RepID=UPI0015F07E01|nr:IPT/TIG domain-containing protein [Streptomyces shenzhenensis]
MATITSLVDTTTTTNQGTAGDTLQINGTGLGTTTRVNFGSLSVSSGLTVTPTQVSLTIPSAQCAGQVSVSVTSSTNVTSNALPFFFVASPSVTGAGTTCGPAAGGTSVTVFGSNFLTGTGATVGGTAVTPAPTFTSSNQVTITTPAHTMTPGSCVDTVDIAVTTAGGTSVPAGSLSQFSYYAAPTITSLSPATGTAGDEIAVNGTCFIDVSSVSFSDGTNTIPATWTALGNNLLSTIVPAGLTPGAGTITVTTCGGPSNAQAFTIT